MSRRFEGKVAIVTGSSSGIGRATAVLFAREGAKVTITGRDPNTLQETKKLILAEKVPESNVLELLCDIIDEKIQQEIVEKTIKKFGEINILVNNAGANPNHSGFTQTMADLDYHFALNTKVATNLSLIAMPHLIKTQGDIVNVSSVAACPLALASAPYYGMAKAAMDSMTRSMAVAYAKQGVRVNSVNPGPVQTAFIRGVEETKRAEIISAYATRIPLGRAGRPEEIANCIAFFADRAACGFTLGATLIVDGGSTLEPHCRAEFNLGDVLAKAQKK